MIAEWRELEARVQRGEDPQTATLARNMYRALNVFSVATLLVRYYEMAMALTIVGMAHRGITRDPEIMAACYRTRRNAPTGTESRR